MTAKKNIFIGSAIATALVYLWEYMGNVQLCTMGGFNSDCWDVLHDAEFIVLPVVTLLFLLSLITYKMREEIFRAWWNFNRWAIPASIFVAILVTFSINSMGSRADMYDRGFAVMFLTALYAILIFVSLWKIARTYWKLKKGL